MGSEIGSASGYVVRWADDCAPSHASGFLFAVDVEGTVTTHRERAAVLPTVGAAVEAASAMRVRDVSILRVHADGREERLPNYEEALALLGADPLAALEAAERRLLERQGWEARPFGMWLRRSAGGAQQTTQENAVQIERRRLAAKGGA